MPAINDDLVSCFFSGDTLRSRRVGSVVLAGHVHVPAPPARLVADWERDVRLHLALEPGEVEPLPLARARARWPDYRHCVQATADWTAALGLPADWLAACDTALMACRGASYHHDGARYGGMAFCNLFLSEDQGLDLHFPAAGQRIPLRRGTVVLFDTCQPHAVIARGSSGFDVADFPPAQDCTQVFLTWEVPIESDAVARLLGVTFDTEPTAALLLGEAHLWRGCAKANVCPATGQWCQGE